MNSFSGAGRAFWSSLLAEGLRKLGLLWLLIQNGTLLQGSVLFWDEPETNLNPRLFGPVVEILLELQRQGVQIFIATHDYLILKQLDLQTTDKDQVAYHALYGDYVGKCRSGALTQGAASAGGCSALSRAG